MKKYVVTALCAGVSCGAVAATDPEGWKVGGAELIPTLQVEVSHDDNIFSQPDDEDSSRITRLKPRLEYLAESGQATFSVVYQGDYGTYEASSDDDYDDHSLEANLDVSPADIIRINFNLYTGELHEARGSLASEGSAATARNKPDEYDQNNYGVMFDFGRETAKFGASIGFSNEDKEYTNNDATTASLSRDETTVTGRLYSRLSGGKTKLFLEGVETDIEYDELGGLGQVQDSEESSILIGAEWEATAKTSGQIKVGRLNKDFDTGFDDDLSVWFVGVTWSPSDYSHLSFQSSQDARESNGNGLYIEARDNSLTWTHYWSDRLETAITRSKGNDEYPGFGREDDRDSFSVGMTYDFKRWMSIGFSYTQDDRDSNVDQFNYSRDIALMKIDLSL